MNRTLKSTLLSLSAMAIIASACVATRPSFIDGRTRDEHRRIAEACISMLRSPLTNQIDIQSDDARLPEVIRALHPIHIEMMPPTDVVIVPSNGPSEYHLNRRPSDPRTWILYCVGSGSNSHRELFRFTHD